MTAVAAEAFRQELFEAELLIPTGRDGLYGRSATFQSIVDALDRWVGRWGSELETTVVHFPPVVSRDTFERTNYLESFPDLVGSVHIFKGGDREHAEVLRRLESGEDWQSLLEPSDVVLCSAQCHVIYPLCAGTLPPAGRRFELHGYCFRHEPSVDPARMQAFTMHELVVVGDPASALLHRDRGLARGLEMLETLGLTVQAVPASDPFFGRLGTMLAAGQLDEDLKWEVVSPISSELEPTAIMSANYHRDHFGQAFGIRTDGGDVAHSACVAFGVDRIALALLRSHGLVPDRWPDGTRRLLWG